jgi:hypothetical protein
MAEALSLTATGATNGATKFVPGPYAGRLVKIEKKYKTIENEGGGKEDRPYLRWIFEVLGEGFEGMTLSVLSSTSFGVGPAGPAKARKFAEAILGRELEIGETFTAEDLYGKAVTLHVDNERSARGTFARIIELTPAAEKIAEGGAEEDEDWESIPF